MTPDTKGLYLESMNRVVERRIIEILSEYKVKSNSGNEKTEPHHTVLNPIKHGKDYWCVQTY